MFFIMYIAILNIAYVITFKDEFKEEEIDKASPFIFIISALVIVLGIMGSI